MNNNGKRLILENIKRQSTINVKTRIDDVVCAEVKVTVLSLFNNFLMQLRRNMRLRRRYAEGKDAKRG